MGVVVLMVSALAWASTPLGAQTGAAPGVTPTTIKIGYITSETGVASSTYMGGAQGAMARFALQNAHGGVDGRKLELVAEDDGTVGNQAAAQDLVENKGVFGVIDFSAFVQGAGAQYLQQQGVPVTGAAVDGPEWAEQPYTNMFSTSPPYYTQFGNSYYYHLDTAKYLKSVGVTKMASLGFSISPSAVQNVKATVAADNAVGIKNCYENTAVSFGQTSFTTEALAIKQAGCNGVIGAMVDASDVGLAASLQQAAVTAKQFYYTGYDQSVLSDPSAAASLSGAYFSASPNFTNPPPGTQTMIAALKKYAPSVKGIPNFGVWGSYQAADVMIEGLEVAGKNPTRQLFITKLRATSGYTGGGLFSPPISFTGFGTPAMFSPQFCSDFVQLRGGKYVTTAKNVCGALIKY